MLNNKFPLYSKIYSTKYVYSFLLVLLSVTFLFINSCSEESTNPEVEQPNQITNPPGTYINKLAVNSKGDLYAGTTSGLYTSSDGGSSWRLITQTVNPDIDVTHIIVTPSNSILISYFLNNSTEVLRTDDNGNSWIVIWTPPGLINTHSYPIETDANENIYVCAQNMYRSTDSGNTWEVIYPGTAYDVFISAGNHIIAGIPGPFAGQIIYSTDDGNKWDSTGYEVNVMAFDDYNSDLYAGGRFSIEGGGGLHKSTDGGFNWALVGFNQISVSSFITSDHNNLFIGTSEGIYYSEDGGVNWQNVLTDSTITTLAKGSNGYLFAGTNYGTLLRSTDNGLSWHN